MDTAVDRSSRIDERQITVLYTRNDDGWITAQIKEYPAAISQGRTQDEAWRNVVDALRDLMHTPTTAERFGAAIQAGLDQIGDEIVRLRGSIREATRAALDLGRHRLR